MSKKILSLALALIMLVAIFTGCNPSKPDDGSSTANPVDPYAGKDHAEISDDLYEKILGEFDEYYQAAKAATTVSERFALMAIAEAKLLETGVMLPSTAKVVTMPSPELLLTPFPLSSGATIPIATTPLLLLRRTP